MVTRLLPGTRRLSIRARHWAQAFSLLILLPLAIAGCGNSVSGPVNNTSATTTTLTAAPTTVAATETTVLTATVANVAGSAFVGPTGTVTFSGNSNVTVAEATLVANPDGISATASVTISGSILSLGANAIVATYSGDQFHTASVSSSVNVSVVATTNTTTTSLTAAPLSITAAQTTTLTATVTNGTATGLPTGNVSFTANGSSAPLGTAALVSGGNASTAVASLQVKGSALTSGANTIVANYLGDVDHAISSSPSVTVTVTGSTGNATTTAVTASPTTFAFGTCSSFSIVVTGPSTGSTAPTGAVALYVNGVQLGAATVSGYGGTSNGTYSGCSNNGTALGASGSYTLTGIYQGDDNYKGSTSTDVALTVSGNTKAQTTTSLSVISQSTIKLGDCASVQAIPTFVAEPNAQLPTGTVQFYVNGSTRLGPATLVPGTSNSIATLSVCTGSKDVITATGTYSITSTYGGDSNYNGSSSNAVTLVVD